VPTPPPTTNSETGGLVDSVHQLSIHGAPAPVAAEENVESAIAEPRSFACELPKLREELGVIDTTMLVLLRWHVRTQLVTPEMEESDLLFPSVTGGFRSPCVLNKPFADIAETIGLGKSFTQRGLRRTFNDLARAAHVEGIVTRSISGHATERMQEHYSTVHGGEQRAGIARVISLFGGERPTAPSGEHGGEQSSPSGEHTKKAG
jgi:hypothetical protein